MNSTNFSKEKFGGGKLMFENIASFLKKLFNKSEQNENSSKTAAKERLHLVLMQDRANVSADFLDLMRQEIIEVIKKYITVDEKEIDVRLINKANEDGTNGAPALVANIPIVSVKNSNKKEIENNRVDINEKSKNIGDEDATQQSKGKDDSSEIKDEKKEDGIEKTENIQDKQILEEENKKEEAQA